MNYVTVQLDIFSHCVTFQHTLGLGNPQLKRFIVILLSSTYFINRKKMQLMKAYTNILEKTQSS